MSDQVHLSGDRINMTEDEYTRNWDTIQKVYAAGDVKRMTPEEYAEIANRLAIGDYSDLVRMFVFAPPVPVQEMDGEARTAHKKLLERAVQILRIQVSFMIDNLNQLAHDASEAERQQLFEYEKKYGPKAKEAIAKRQKKVAAREKMIEQVMEEKGWDRVRASKFVDMMCADDEEDDANALVAEAEAASAATGIDAVSETVDELKPGDKCACGHVFGPTELTNLQVGSLIFLTATCTECKTLYRKALK